MEAIIDGSAEATRHFANGLLTRAFRGWSPFLGLTVLEKPVADIAASFLPTIRQPATVGDYSPTSNIIRIIRYTIRGCLARTTSASVDEQYIFVFSLLGCYRVSRGNREWS